MNPNLVICASGDDFAIEAAAETADPKTPRKFSMTAYTGAPMRLPGWGFPVVASIMASDQGEGIKTPRQSVPIDKNHDMERIVGHTTTIDKSAQRVYASGVISGHHESEGTPSAVSAREVIRLAANGFPWQASILADPSPGKTQFIDRGETAKVNGRIVAGPAYVVWESVLRAISFVATGADGNTSASVAASFKGQVVNEQWIIAQGFDPKTLNDAQRAFLQAAYDREHATPPTQTPPATPLPPAANPVAELRASMARETERIAGLRRICAQFQGIDVEIDDPAKPGSKRRVPLESHAIAAEWSEAQTELYGLQHRLPQVPQGFVSSGKPEVNSQVIEAAMVRTLGGDVSGYTPQTMEAADRSFRTIGLQQIIQIAASANGFQFGTGERITTANIRSVLQHAFAPTIRASSAFSLPGILGNVANKQLLAGYMEEDDTWREISRVVSASTFHDRTFYRMLDDMAYEEIGPDGQIKHGKVSSESYTASLSTFAKMFALDRRDIINDELGAFDDLRSRLGRGAKKKFNDLFWTNMLAGHSSFFTAGRGNYITGATTTLLTDGVGLGLGLKAFRQMKSSTEDGAKRINARPAILLHPPELESAADKIFAGEKLNVGSAGGGDENIYRNKYRPVCNAWLSDSAFTGYSTTAWYLFRAASDMAMMIVSFLNGNEFPTVESADADFNTLGIQFRGYHDFYANQAEYLCGVKSKGAA